MSKITLYWADHFRYLTSKSLDYKEVIQRFEDYYVKEEKRINEAFEVAHGTKRDK